MVPGQQVSDQGVPGDVPGVARIPPGMVSELHRLRGHTNLRGAVSNVGLWLRWESLDRETRRELLQIPRIEFYFQDGQGNWKRPEDRLPRSISPPNSWMNLKTLLAATLPAAGFGLTQVETVPLRLTRDNVERTPGAMVISARNWLQFAEEAPDLRLSPLKFAASASGEILVVGEPVPSLPGERFYCEQGVAIASGWKLSPIDDLSVVEELLMLVEGDLALIRPVIEESFHQQDDVPLQVAVVTTASFVAATRSAIRATCRRLISGDPESGSR